MTTTDTPVRQVILRASDLTTAPIKAFIDSTLLHDCTNVVTHPNGTIEVEVRSWGFLSSTEVRLWNLLVDMTSGTLRGIADYGDFTHRNEVAIVVAQIMGVA